MFEVLIWISIGVVLLGMAYAYAGSRDVFHPIMFIGPMLLFMYAWMPLKLNGSGSLDGFFQKDQLVHVQLINLGGITAFILGCLSLGCRLPKIQPAALTSSKTRTVLVIAGVFIGCIGVAAWCAAIINVGGLYDAFSEAYSGGWDDNGYVRDASLLMF